MQRGYADKILDFKRNGRMSVCIQERNAKKLTKYTDDFYGNLATYTDGLGSNENYSYLDNITGNDTD